MQNTENRSPRVLLIDDDAGAFRVAAVLAQECVCAVDHVSDLSELGDSVEPRGYSVLLLSLGLGGRVGTEAYLVARSRAAGVPIVVLAESGQEMRGLEAVRQGAADYLIRTKLDATLLTRSIKHALEQHGAQELNDPAELALQRERDFAAAVIDSSGALIIVLDRLGQIVRFNHSCERLTGYADTELVGRRLWEVLVPRAEVEVVIGFFGKLITGGGAETTEYHWLGKDGALHRISWSNTILTDGRGEVQFVVATGIEVTERRRSEEALRRSEAKYRALFEQSRDAIYVTDLDGTILETNHAMHELLGFSANELIGSDLESLHADPVERALFRRERTARKSITDLEVRLRRKDGNIVWCLLSIWPRQLPSGQTLGFQGIVHDITDRKRAEQRLLHNAYHDVLTGLPNRALFLDRLERAMSRWHREPRALFAVLFLDLDRFKVVNDSLGHSSGDELLVQMASLIRRCIRDEDTVARMGGDEFAILLDRVESETDAVLVAERVHTCLEQPLQIGGQNVFISCSAGISLPRSRDEKPEELLRNADLAMYRAKSEGPARHAVYAPDMLSAAVTILELDMDLRMALQDHQFLLHYQPIYTLTGALSGFEALLRWRHPRRGLLAPSEFLHRAEETGLIVQMGRWVIREVCARLGAWNRICGAARLPFISCNVSGRQLSQADLVGEVAAALREYSVPRDRLMLELTETSLMQNPETCALTIRRLRDLGVRFAIDDFGTGYSSLSYLHRLPISGLKIDRSFITRLDHGEDSAELVATIVALAENLGIDAVAEGVETERQYMHLQRLKPRYVQGFYLSHPLEAETVARLIQAAA